MVLPPPGRGRGLRLIRLDGEVAIVAGAAGGIGRGVALAMAAQGTRPAMVSLVERVTGIGGFFVRARDSGTLKVWHGSRWGHLEPQVAAPARLLK